MMRGRGSEGNRQSRGRIAPSTDAVPTLLNLMESSSVSKPDSVHRALSLRHFGKVSENRGRDRVFGTDIRLQMA
jgi:hypothetical protein